MRRKISIFTLAITFLFSSLCCANNSISNEQAKQVMFNAVYYANLYPDLKQAFGYDGDKLYKHYLEWGIKEGRSASPIFDPKYYLNNNVDLKRAYGNDYTAAYYHWINWGCSEGRNSSPYYNGDYYRRRYSDLQNAYFSDGINANNYYRLALHYIEWGIDERRQANIEGLVPNNMARQTSSIEKKYIVATNGAALALRNAPNGQIQLRMPNGSVVIGYEENNGWRKVIYNGQIGYAYNFYLRENNSSQTYVDNSNSNSILHSPVPSGAKFNRKTNDNGWYGYHDINQNVAKGTPVYAISDGMAVYKQANTNGVLTSYGNWIEFTSSDGVYKAKYCHLDSFNGVSQRIASSNTRQSSGGNSIVLATKSVKKGEVIGYIGCTGNASGVHLHFELRKNNQRVDPVSVINGLI